VETCDEKDAAVPVAQEDPRVLSSHARQGSCAGRRVDGAKLASGAVAASKRIFATQGATGAGSWAAATPKRVTERTTEIIDGGGSEWW